MSKIDLDRLVVRETYYIPLKSSELKDVILQELNPGRVFYHINKWLVLEEHVHGLEFTADPKYTYIVDKFETYTTPPSKEEVRQAELEYNKGGPDTYFKVIERTRGSTPIEFHLFIKEENENSCLCDVECVPNLYYEIFQLHREDVKDIEIQDANLSCKRFLRYIFQGGLDATLFKEDKRPIPQPTYFLTNDQDSRQILNRIEAMLDQATGEVLICGWIGTILLPKLKELKRNKISVRIMTHKSTELKGKPGRQDVQRAHKELISSIGKENILLSPECHFRVLVVDNKALVGSMDFNAISLTGTHREFAIYTEIPEIVRSIRNYFNQIFTPLSE